MIGDAYSVASGDSLIFMMSRDVHCGRSSVVGDKMVLHLS